MSEKKHAMRGKKDKHNLTMPLKGFFYFFFLCAASALGLEAGEKGCERGIVLGQLDLDWNWSGIATGAGARTWCGAWDSPGTFPVVQQLLGAQTATV